MKTLLAILKRWPHVHGAFLGATLAMLFTPDSPAWILTTAFIGVLWVVCIRHQVQALTFLLASVLICQPVTASTPDRPTQQGAATACGLAVAVVVIVVGGVVVVKIYRFCKRKAANPAPAADPYGVWEGSSCVGTKQSCARMADVGGPAVHVRLSGGADGGLTVTRIHDSELVDDGAWDSSMSALGFTTTWGTQSWVRDGQSIPEHESRISIGPDVIDVRGDDMRLVRIESSHDLVNWDTVTTLSIPAGMAWEMCDSSDAPQTYYRRSE